MLNWDEVPIMRQGILQAPRRRPAMQTSITLLAIAVLVASGAAPAPASHPVPSPVAPTRLLWGECDAVFSRGDQEALRSGIAESRLVTYPETGHAPHWERPDEFARRLQAIPAGD